MKGSLGGVEEEERGWEEKEDRKNAKRGNKSNIGLELSSFRYHRNCYWDFVNKLQINAAKSAYDFTSSDNAPFNYILKSILNKENKIWNTNELIDANWNMGTTESISTRIVNTSCLIENFDWFGYNTEWYANHLRSKSHGSERGEGRKGGHRRSKTEKMLSGETIVTLN